MPWRGVVSGHERDMACPETQGWDRRIALSGWPIQPWSPEDRSIDGRTNGQIGQELGLRETVKDYVSSIPVRTRVARRAEAAASLARHTALPGG